MKIGLDVMGGDFAPKATIEGAILAHKELPSDVKIVLIGDKDIIKKGLADAGASENDFEIVHTTEVIEMGEHPTKAFTQKPNSSIAIGFGMLKKNLIQAFASAGNSGAMLVGSMYAIGPIQGVIRPSILATVPKLNGGYQILIDIGINPDAKPDVMYQLGIMGSVYASTIHNIKNPKVGLLNIGEEEEKGNLLCQSAYKVMKDSKDFNFIGNVESRDLFRDKVDVIVCDGFTGNIVLKLVENMYRIIVKRGINDDFFNQFNYENHGGSPIIGINSTVMVGHGISNDKAIKSMVTFCKEVNDAKLTEKIQLALQEVIQTKEQ